MTRYLLAWLAMLLVSVYGKHLPDLLAQQLSTLSGIVLLGAVIYLYVRRWPPASGRQALNISLFWMSTYISFRVPVLPLCWRSSLGRVTGEL